MAIGIENWLVFKVFRTKASQIILLAFIIKN
jgi:hypothetical protein